MVGSGQSAVAERSESVSLHDGPSSTDSQLGQADQRVVARLHSFAAVLGACVVFISLLAITSWITGIVSLRRIAAARSEMKLNTAVALLLAGAALAILPKSTMKFPVRRWTARLLACVPIVIAATTALEYLVARDFGIDNAVFRLVGSRISGGRMAPHTAFGLLCASVAILLITTHKKAARLAGQILAVFAGAFAILALFGYTFQMSPLYKLGEPSFMALPTAVALALLAKGALFASSESGFMSTMTTRGGGALMLRRVLPLALAAPWAIAWLMTRGTHSGLYHGDTDNAMFAASLMVFMAVLLFLNARSLNRLDAENESARELLKQNSEHWQLTFNCMSEGLSYHAPDYSVVAANTAFNNMLSGECRSGEKCYRLVHGTDAPPQDCPMRETLDTGQTATKEIFEPRLGRHLQVRTDPVRDASGNIFRIVHVVEDITDRKRSEDHLRRLAAIVESSKDAIYSVDLEGRILSWNRGAERMFGYSAEEIMGSTPQMLYPADDQDRWHILHSQVVKGERIEDLEMRRVRKDGSEIEVSLSISPLRDGSGTITGTSAIVRDISIRKRAQAEAERRSTEAQHARAELNAVFDSMGEGLYQLDYDGRLVFMNVACERILGYSLEELRGRQMHEIIHSQFPDGRFRPAHNCPLVQVIARGETHHANEDFFQRRDGSFIPVEYTSSPLVVDGAIHGAVLSFRDITERKRAEEERSRLLELERQVRREVEARSAEVARLNAELEQRVLLRTAELEVSNRELEAFSYSVSHDLRAPLRSIDGFSHILLDEYNDKLDDEGRDFLNRLRNASQQMGQLIDALLLLSRVSRSEMTKSDVNLSELVDAIAADLRNSDPNRAVTFEVAPNVVVQGDSRLLHSALQNLVGNAWKFTAKRERALIQFGLTEKDGRRVYFIRDNGAGFEMEYASKLFIAFQRLHSASEFEGSGIGLATVQRIVRRHGGTVWAEGQPGAGATFYFTLQ